MSNKNLLSLKYNESPSRASSHSDLEKAFKNLDHQNQGKIKKSVILSASMYTSDFYDRNIIQRELQKCPSQITFQKFQSIFELAQVFKEDTSAEWIFRLYDKDNKGFINREDLKRASLVTGIELSEEEISQMLQAQNPMVEGRVHFDDFFQIMNRQIQFQ